MRPAADRPTPDTLPDRLRRFFYADEVPYGLALVRLLMPLVLLYPMLPRWMHCREYYSTDGANTPLWIQYGYAHMLPEVSGSVAVALYTLMLLCLVTSAAGFLTRVSLVGAFVLYTYFNLLDSVGTMTKYSVIASHVLLLLSLSQCGSVWSLDAWLSGRWRRRRAWPGEAPVEWPRSPAWPRRLMQLLLGFVYFGAAVTKMHTPAFFSGDQMRYWTIANINFKNPLGEYVSLYPSAIVAACYVALVWEVLFLFLAWQGLGRRLMLTLGVMFHVGTFLTLGLRVFPMLSMVIYFAFLNEADVRSWAAFFRRRLRRWGLRPAWPKQSAAISDMLRLPRPAVFGLLALLAMFLGPALEHRLDPYGERRPEGPYALREMDPARALTMLAPSRPIRVEDKIFSFDVGTLTVGGNLARRKSEFRTGESLIVEIMMSPPYEDMWVECILADDDNRRVDGIGQSVVTREMARGHFCYTVPPSLDPGRYWLVLSCAGKEVDRRPITVSSARRQAPLAN
ncbi:MAG TPA: HTTM domain-containing protein [Planctomycetaceae bacterium]|nr:HTTM domain-containing protein [Planctomycetaceae bacterium]